MEQTISRRKFLEIKFWTIANYLLNNYGSEFDNIMQFKLNVKAEWDVLNSQLNKPSKFQIALMAKYFGWSATKLNGIYKMSRDKFAALTGPVSEDFSNCPPVLLRPIINDEKSYNAMRIWLEVIDKYRQDLGVLKGLLVSRDKDIHVSDYAIVEQWKEDPLKNKELKKSKKNPYSISLPEYLIGELDKTIELSIKYSSRSHAVTQAIIEFIEKEKYNG